jgi:Ca-activated chloride channel family protein
MFRRFSVLAIAAVAVAAWLAVTAAGQNSPGRSGALTTLVGSVVDEALTPLQGVALQLEQQGRVVAATKTDASGGFRLPNIPAGAYKLQATLDGFVAVTRDLVVSASSSSLRIPVVLTRGGVAPVAKQQLEAASAARDASQRSAEMTAGVAGAPLPSSAVQTTSHPLERASGNAERVDGTSPGHGRPEARIAPAAPFPGIGYPGGERYAHVTRHDFESADESPVSTFGADVDTASYTNVRRFLTYGQLPPSDAVRVEEFINYFQFGYPAPRRRDPMSLTTEVGECPWAPAHKLMLIGARAQSAAAREVSTRNIVLLVDVSGSMAPAERLPMLKSAFAMFVDTLRPDDHLAIVTYAGSSGVALYPTPARRRDVIQAAIAGLGAGGSTNGAQGIVEAYRLARQSFVPGGVNRVILATDGDFNVGVTSQHDLLRLIERERTSGVFLSVLGVGVGNLKDETMEMLADKGNGHYAYLDSLQEARRVLVLEGASTLETVAKDVKFQVHFDPRVVSAYKLIGYENRVMPTEHFDDDRKDGGEMGAGHTVTVLYEIVPAQRSPHTSRHDDSPAGTLALVKARYKLPDDDESRLLTHPVRSDSSQLHLPFAATVAEFGLRLRDGGSARQWHSLAARAQSIAQRYHDADRSGFADLVVLASGLQRRAAVPRD